jgi:hypothetical protein
MIELATMSFFNFIINFLFFVRCTFKRILIGAP